MEIPCLDNRRNVVSKIQFHRNLLKLSLNEPYLKVMYPIEHASSEGSNQIVQMHSLIIVIPVYVKSL